MASGFADYLDREWESFFRDAGRLEASRRAAAHLDVRRVLDVGCGAGQELAPFTGSGALGVGIDVAPESAEVGRRQFARYDARARVAFVRAGGERLPFGAATFDVVICRVALPYMDNPRVLAEIARVLAPGGILLLKIHHPRYYLRQWITAIPRVRVRSFVHASRVLVSGVLYHLLGRQIRRKPVGPETFQTRWLLRRQLGDLRIVGEMPDSNPLTPSFIIAKPAGPNR